MGHGAPKCPKAIRNFSRVEINFNHTIPACVNSIYVTHRCVSRAFNWHMRVSIVTPLISTIPICIAKPKAFTFYSTHSPLLLPELYLAFVFAYRYPRKPVGSYSHWSRWFMLWPRRSNLFGQQRGGYCQQFSAVLSWVIIMSEMNLTVAEIELT